MNPHDDPPKRLTVELDELASYVGQEVGVSPWLLIEQDRITTFADCTEDRQWIHIDPEKASGESPFEKTIAHGFLTLSLISHFVGECLEINDTKVGINYGLNRVRFPHPVAVGSRLRGRVLLQSCEAIQGGIQYHLAVTIEIDGIGKPACVAEVIFRALR